MPRRMTQTKPGTHQVLKNSSFESRVISWLMQDGWQIFTPILDCPPLGDVGRVSPISRFVIA
jgi:hypothetical protein